MNNINDKLFIRDYIKNIDYDLIINFVKTNDIIYTQNKNGIFFDLNSFSDDKIDFLKNIIKNNIESMKKLNYEKKLNITDYNNNINNKKNNKINEINKIIINKIYIDEFTKSQQGLIKLSKKYL